MNRLRRIAKSGVHWPLLGGASILALWFGVIHIFNVEPYIAPDPYQVLLVMIGQADILLQNTIPTAQECLLGFFLGNGAAILVAVVFVYSKTTERMYYPIAVLFNTVPIIALSPILVLIFGLGMAPKIIIAAIICFFPTLVNMIRGLKSVSQSEMELMRILSANRREIFFKLRLQRSLPYLFSALRIASTTCVIGAIVGEWIGSNLGLGALIIQATFNYRSGLLYAAIFMSSGLAITLFSIVVWLEKCLVHWQEYQNKINPYFQLFLRQHSPMSVCTDFFEHPYARIYLHDNKVFHVGVSGGKPCP
jgi:NitT/TauT family transport system permease protein